MVFNLKQVYYNLLLTLAIINIGFIYAVTLEENSPFIPYDYVSGQADFPLPSQQNFVELHGILDFGKEPKFSLYNTKTQKSVWVKMNDKRAPYFIDSYDPEEKIIAITINGVRQQLEISKPADDAKTGSGLRGISPPRPSNDVRSNAPVDEEDEEEEDDEEEEEDDIEELSDEEQAQRRREMSERVYKAFQQYVSERRGET